MISYVITNRNTFPVFIYKFMHLTWGINCMESPARKTCVYIPTLDLALNFKTHSAVRQYFAQCLKVTKKNQDNEITK